MEQGGSIQTREQFEDNPQGDASFWQTEINAAQQEVRKFHQQGDKIVKRYLDERPSRNSVSSRLNLFSSGINLQRSLLFGNVPSIDISRRFSDATDDAARVGSEMIERLLNGEIEDNRDGYVDSVEQALFDRLTPGLGVARVRYTAEFEQEEIEAMMAADGVTVEVEAYTEERKVSEDALIDYVQWKDFLWSPARVWTEVRWVAFRAYVTRDEAEQRFGKDKARRMQYVSREKGSNKQGLGADPWQRAEVWEIWCKDSRMVYWWTQGCEEILDKKEDPLGLRDFFPCPKPMFANLTTSALVPRADFTLYQDQYNEIDVVTTRINMLQSAVRVVGLYDASQPGIKRMLTEAGDNELIPVDQWAAFAERGGIRGQIEWMPLADIIGAMDKLRDYRRELIELLDQVTGMSDIVRGQAAAPNVTATEQKIKGRFASARLQYLQERVADFAADLQRIKAEVIVNLFDDQTIIERSNILQTPDAQKANEALQLIRSRFAEYRVKIQSDQMALADYAAMQAERQQYIQGLSQFMTAAAPLVQQDPSATPFLLEMLKWGMSGFRGAQQIEGVLDRAVEAMQRKSQQPPGDQKPDPEMQKLKMKAQADQQKQQAKMMEIQAKAQAEMQKIQAEAAAEMQKLQAEVQAAGAREAEQFKWNTAEKQAAEAIKQQGQQVVPFGTRQ